MDKINTLHPALIEALDQIGRSRDAFKGTDAVKDAGVYPRPAKDEDYLPKLDGQNKAQYASYKKRAVFYAAMNRTVTALAGAMDRKPAELDNAESIADFLKDVTGTGKSLDEFLSEVETEILISGRAVICVDRKGKGTDNRPYLIWYKSEDCINWFSKNYSDFDEMLSGMVFKESYYAPSKDNKYEQELNYQFREYTMIKGTATVNIWRAEQTNNKAETLGSPSEAQYKIAETYTLTNRGKALGFLPCIPVVCSGSSFDIPKPPLLDLTDVNFAHYRNSADLEHGLHWTALPTPWFSGLDGTAANITVGSGEAILMNDPSSKAGFLEFSGTGLKAIKDAMDHKEMLMSALGARMLSTRADQSTSAEVTRINYSGETASLSNIAKSISRGITKMLRVVAAWENKKSFETIVVHLNEDYVDTKLAGQDILALMQAHQGGVMSIESLLWNLSQGERLPLGRTIEDEIDLIEAGMDKEADEAEFWGDTNVEFKGNQFSSPANSKTLVEEDINIKEDKLQK